MNAFVCKTVSLSYAACKCTMQTSQLKQLCPQARQMHIIRVKVSTFPECVQFRPWFLYSQLYFLNSNCTPYKYTRTHREQIGETYWADHESWECGQNNEYGSNELILEWISGHTVCVMTDIKLKNRGVFIATIPYILLRLLNTHTRFSVVWNLEFKRPITISGMPAMSWFEKKYIFAADFRFKKEPFVHRKVPNHLTPFFLT